MPVPVSPNLHIYVLSVGEGDTSLIRTPSGKLILIDAYRAGKLTSFLQSLGLADGEEIRELIITHPHTDHFEAASALVDHYAVESVSLAPFWHKKGWGSKSYRTLINQIEAEQIPVHFVSGYGRVYPEDLVAAPAVAGGDPAVRTDVPYLEILGPPNSLVRNLTTKKGYGVNHLSIMSRLTWGNFSMIFAADAQMENWAYFDSEGMLEQSCDALRAAHHGSKNGTQWERLQRLQPEVVIVSSYPDGKHDIPDLIGCAALKEYYDKRSTALVSLTHVTGTIEIQVRPNGGYDVFRYADPRGDDIVLGNRASLSRATDPTNWHALLQTRL